MIELLERASIAGIEVWYEGGKLHVKGHERAGWLAHEILAHKEDVVAALQAQTRAAPAYGPCPWCKGAAYWWRPDGTGPVCKVCHPDPGKAK